MYALTRILNWGGLASVALGGLLSLVGLAKGKEARQLESVTQVTSLAALKSLLAVAPLLVAISGRVWSNKPLKGELSDEEAAIVQVTEERVSERRTDLMWVKESDQVRSMVRETEWGLKEGSLLMPVQQGQDASGSFMEVSKSQWIPAEERLPGLVLGELSGRRYLGMRQVERVLPLGAAVTAVGELAAVVDYPNGYPGALRGGGKMYVLRAPRSGPFVLTRQALPDLIASLKTTSRTCNKLSLVFVSVGAGLLLLSALESAAARWRRRRMQERIERARREHAAARAARGELEGDPGGAAGAGEGEAAPEGRPTCVVCFSREPDMVFPACGHLCACSACSGNLTRCPMCRGRGRPIRVFTP